MVELKNQIVLFEIGREDARHMEEEEGVVFSDIGGVKEYLDMKTQRLFVVTKD